MLRMRLFEGHYRALERDFSKLLPGLLRGDGNLWVVSAGSEQLDRLREIALEAAPGNVLAGTRFLPGILHLARSLSGVPVRMEKVSHFDRTSFTLSAMEELSSDDPFYGLKGSQEAAHSLGCFFEDLYEHGVDPGLYDLTSLSLQRERTATELTVGKLMESYGRLRRSHYSCCGDMVMQREMELPDGDPLILYGFYDLNPLQRRFLKRLLGRSGEVYWFSPVTVNSSWEPVYRRTRNLLDQLGHGTVERSDRDLSMNDFGTFLESLRSMSRCPSPPPGLEIAAVSGEMGACRSALESVSALEREGVPLRRIAVVRRKGEGDNLVRMASHEGIPVNAPLTVRLVQMPPAQFLLDLLRFICSDFFHVYLESMLSWNLLRDEYRVSPSAVAGISAGSGVRMGSGRWRDWYASCDEEENLGKLLRKVDDFQRSLPDRANPGVFLRKLREFTTGITVLDAEGPVTGSLFDKGCIRSGSEMTLESFGACLRLHYQSVDVRLREADGEGFRVLSPETIRGGSYRSVIMMDMEEGIYPRPQLEDPRLSEEMRERLQLAPRSQREMEDALLLRQAGEAAEETFGMVFRQQAGDGGEICPSPFIAGLVIHSEDAPPNTGWLRRESSSPVTQVLDGGHPGQAGARRALQGDDPGVPGFASALEAERSRMALGSFDRYDGILGGTPLEVEKWSPTMLEAYARCPFAFLAERIWKLQREEPSDIGSAPDPSLRGLIIHDSVETAVRLHGFDPPPGSVLSIVEEAAESRGLAGLLGTQYLCDTFIRRESRGIERSLAVLKSRGWSFMESEASLNGSLGSLEITGRIDLVLEDANSGLVLLDLKSGSVPKRSDVEKGLAYQLPFYHALASQNYSGRRVNTVAYASVSQRTPGRLLEWTGESMESLMGKVTDNASLLAGMIEDGIFPPAPTAGCDHCAYRGLCRLTPQARIKTKAGADPRTGFFAERLSLK